MITTAHQHAEIASELLQALENATPCGEAYEATASLLVPPAIAHALAAIALALTHDDPITAFGNGAGSQACAARRGRP